MLFHRGQNESNKPSSAEEPQVIAFIKNRFSTKDALFLQTNVSERGTTQPKKFHANESATFKLCQKFHMEKIKNINDQISGLIINAINVK